MPPVVGASIDVGSNSVHLLVATVAAHRLTPLADESVFLGLGAAVHDRGALGPVGRAGLADALAVYAEVARDLGAPTVTVAGTEPMRRAADAPRSCSRSDDGPASTCMSSPTRRRRC